MCIAGIAGFAASHHTGRSRALADAIAEAHPETYETWFYFDGNGGFRGPKPHKQVLLRTSPTFHVVVGASLRRTGAMPTCDPAQCRRWHPAGDYVHHRSSRNPRQL